MILESWLAFFHISAILAWIVFATSQAALCRSDWMNVATLQRLARMDRILWVATAAVLLSGLARIWWGSKGLDFYAGNLLLYSKIALFAVVASLQVGPSRQYRSWMTELQETQELPADERVRSARRHVMVATHLMALIPLPAVFLARGFGG